jgi:cytochrome P450
MTEAVPRDAPCHVLDAVTHADPYPFYARRTAERPLGRDEMLGLWIASSAESVTAVLTHPALRVRPPAEPVPKALLGSPAAEVFGCLVRMRDGDAHGALKRAVTATFDGLTPARVAAAAEREAAVLGDGFGRRESLTRFAYALSARVVGALLGFDDAVRDEVARLAGEAARAVFPGGTSEQVERGKGALARLMTIAGEHVGAGPGDSMAALANTIGFLLQAHDATAALIGTTLLTLARRPDLLARIEASPDALPAFVDEVVRFDAPVQNTRRFAAEPVVFGDATLESGEAVLVLLAAANRDPRANPDPHRFDPERRGARVFTFGIGPHACPGRAVATAITCAGVTRLLANGLDPRRLDRNPRYHPSPNCRSPILYL